MQAVAAFVAVAAAAAGCLIKPHVDRHLVRNAMDAGLTPTLGWTISPGCGPALQTAVAVQLCPARAAGDCDHPDPTWIHTNLSDAVPFAVWGGDALKPGASYTVRVLITFGPWDGTQAPRYTASALTPFHTQLTPALYAAGPPLWVAPTTVAAPPPRAGGCVKGVGPACGAPQYAMFRLVLPTGATGAGRTGGHPGPSGGSSPAETFLAITAKPAPDLRTPHGRNTSHLLCAYKLWVDGVPLGAGPGRRVGGALNVDTYNLTALLTAPAPGGAHVLSVESYYRSPNATGDRGAVVMILHDGDGNTISPSSPVAGWKAFDATAAFGPSLGTADGSGGGGAGLGAGGSPGKGAGTGSYSQPHENIDMRRYPTGWRTAAYDDSSWAPAVVQPTLADALAAKEALPVSLRAVPAAGFTVLSEATDAATGAVRYRYLVDFGKNLQGGVNASFLGGAAGQTVEVRLGEQLLTPYNGSVKYHMESGNTYSDTWTLAGPARAAATAAAANGSAGGHFFVTHEYSEFRWAEVIGAPEPPTHARVGGWQVHYPFDGQLNEDGLVVQPALNAPRRRPAGVGVGSGSGLSGSTGLAEFSASVSALEAVFELVRHTVDAASLDLNTDSNTRQRDLCTLDAWLATRWQGGLAPATSAHLRRRVTQNMFEPNGFVNWWSEFLLAHVGALHDYATEYGDTTVAAALWRQGSVNMGSAGSGRLGLDNYSLLAYYDPGTDLVHHTPKPLIDWPRSDGIDTTGVTSRYCTKLCVQINAYAVLAQGWMAGLATRLNDHAESAAYSGRAARIRAAAQTTFAAYGENCTAAAPTPPAPPQPTAIKTCANEWEADTPRHRHGSDGQVALNCGPGQIINDVHFADFGTPAGSCVVGFTSDSNCTSNANKASGAKFVVKSSCLGKQYCFLEASTKLFGEPCNGVTKRLAVQVTCTAATAADSAIAASTSGNAGGAFRCYTDTPAAGSDPSSLGATTATATALAALSRLPGTAAGVLALVPFLQARQARRGATHGVETSGWMTGFMLEGIYAAAGEVNEGPLPLASVATAAEYGHATLVNTGLNSWMGMLAQNATMTMESWIQPPVSGDGGTGGGTFSHPWTAAPAWIIPRFLMGLRPLADGWRRVAIRPLPAKALASASIELLTLRGPLGLAFAASASAFRSNFTIPGNTVAEVCLPRYLFSEAAACTVALGGAAVATRAAGGLLCLEQDLGPGVYAAIMSC